MSTMTNYDKAARLLEIKEEMAELLAEAIKLVRGTDEENRARAYWYAHIRMALDDNHDYLGHAGATMQDTAESLEEDCEEDEDEG